MFCLFQLVFRQCFLLATRTDAFGGEERERGGFHVQGKCVKMFVCYIVYLLRIGIDLCVCVCSVRSMCVFT